MSSTSNAVSGSYSATPTVPANQPTTLYAAASDQATNVSACSAGVTYTEDSDPPNTPVFSQSTPPE